MPGHSDLSIPRTHRTKSVNHNPEAFGALSEGIAQRLGTARFLVFQTFFIATWVVLNIALPSRMRFDDPIQGFIRLTLVLSLQSAYAAPLILLAQNRQERRQRTITDVDRRVAKRTQDDTRFLAREISSTRVAASAMVTTDELTKRIGDLSRALDQLADRLEQLEAPTFSLAL